MKKKVATARNAEFESKRIIKNCLASGVLLASLSLTSSALAVDKANKIHFDIPSNNLATALLTYSEATGIQLNYPQTLVSGLKSSSVTGDYTPEQALQKLLVGANIAYHYVDKDAIALAEAPKENSTIGNTLKPVTVSGKAVYDPNDPYNADYSRPNATTATKTDTPIMETPASIQVVPKSVMEDQKSTRIKDALENVSGVRPQSTTAMGTGFIMRGFLNKQTYRNGLIASTGGSLQSEFDTANIQSVEVLKGPAAVLYGRAEPGGLINITTKKPLDIPFYSLEQQFGSYDLYRTQWDATGPVTDDGTLLYRFTGAYQSNNSFRDFISTDRINIAPTVTWKPTDATDVTLSVEYMNQDYQADLGIPAIGNRPASIPISRSYGSDPNLPIALYDRCYD